MAGPDASAVLRPNLIDRLSGPLRAPGERERRRLLEGVSASELRESVARDLSWLLNTRIWHPWEGLDSLEEASRSILTYGMPELSRFSWTSSKDARTIARLVEQAIQTFEPRLLARSVKCSVSPSKDIDDFSLRIRIEAVLQVEPISEPVAFDTALDLEGGGLRIESLA